ncbi:LysR family transcriptional regulator [Chitinibacter bivalviorum]|uniref:LysR family transcriptional regulator n=1 Tax=Chitinibacter bivalviorum TaxID=2739434 RepID=A0A7H9BNF3_9NEIS|nr:LysR family transcriptional regulator [Chitinibacter bivalviorum]QLG89561.1 LysR family transcriptional regulator [Chitinibacter bivalviorum]
MSTNQLIALLPDMAVFVRVVECGSFSAAAKELGLSASAVSRQIARLERALSVRLLERSTRSLRLSDAGQAALTRCQSMLAAAQEAMQVSEQYIASPQGRVRLAVPRGFARAVLQSLITPFLQQNTGIELQLVVTDRLIDPLEDEIDLVIRIGDQPPPGLIGLPLMQIEQVLAASPAYLAQHGVPQSPQDLLEHACICLGESPIDHRWRLSRGKEEATVSIAGPLRVNHSEMRLQASLDGIGIASLPDFTARSALAAGRLQRVLSDWRLGTSYAGTAYLLYPAHRYLPPKLRCVIDALVAHCRGQQLHDQYACE